MHRRPLSMRASIIVFLLGIILIAISLSSYSLFLLIMPGIFIGLFGLISIPYAIYVKRSNKGYQPNA